MSPSWLRRRSYCCLGNPRLGGLKSIALGDAAGMDAVPLFARHRLFRRAGPPVHVNRVVHQGEVNLHRHEFIELAVVLGGSASHRTLRGSEPIAAGTGLAIAPDCWHGYDGCCDLLLSNCCLGPELVQGDLRVVVEDPLLVRLLGFDPAQPLTRVQLAPSALAEAERALDRLRGFIPAGTARHRLEVLGNLLCLLGVVGSAAASDQAPSRRGVQPAVARAVAAMSADLARPWTLGELAAAAGVAPDSFTRLFRRHTGLAPMAWLARARGERAAVLLLSSTRSVAEIGRDVGWDDPNYCARRFRELFGQSPSDYRDGGGRPG